MVSDKSLNIGEKIMIIFLLNIAWQQFNQLKTPLLLALTVACNLKMTFFKNLTC